MSKSKPFGDTSFAEYEEEVRRFHELLPTKEVGASEQVRVLLGWMGIERIKQMNDFLENS